MASELLVFTDRDAPSIRSAESLAAEFWLEHRLGAHAKSLTNYVPADNIHGRSTSALDVEETVQRIERAAQVIAAPWRWAVLVALGWRCGRRQLPEMLRRAQLPEAVPMGFGPRQVAARGAELRESLIGLGVVDRGPARAAERLAAAVAAGGYEQGGVQAPERAEEAEMSERPIVGWKAIAEELGVSRNTAKRLAAREETPLPILRPSGSEKGSVVMALPSALSGWLRSHAAPAA